LAFFDATLDRRNDNGTWNFAVVAGCAYPDHHPVMAVLRPLSGRSFSNKAEQQDRRITPSGFAFRQSPICFLHGCFPDVGVSAKSRAALKNSKGKTPWGQAI
jgi:hypothetical protein